MNRRKVFAVLMAIVFSIIVGCGHAKEHQDEQKTEFSTSKYHVVNDNKIYFRQYSEDSIVEGNVLGNYEEVKSAPKLIVSLDEEGQLSKVFEDYGYGSIYLSDGNLFSQYISEDGSSRVYSCNLDGKNKKIWSSQEILDKSQEGFLICKTDNNGLAIIDKNKEQIIVQDNVQYQGCFDNIIYYSCQQESAVELYSVNQRGQKKKITAITVSEAEEKGDYDSEEIKIGNLNACGGYVSFAAGNFFDENIYYGGVIVLCKSDGTEKKVYYSESSKNSLYNEDDKIALLYENGDEVRCEVLTGELVKTFDNVPKCLKLDAYHSVTGYVKRTDKKETYLSEEEYEELLTEIESNHVYQSDFNEIKNAEVVDNKLFFNIVLEKANPAKDIGWRAYYERVVTYEYVKDLKSGVITNLYIY